MLRRTAVICMRLEATVSTAELYAASHKDFTPRFAKQRASIDYKYHNNYTLDRQLLQDRIIEQLVPRRQLAPVANPWMVFSAGAMGAGKTRTLHWMAEQGHFPLSSFIFLDHDAIKYLLPEMWNYQLRNPENAGTLTQREAGFIVEIATRVCIDNSVNCLVDGSLRDSHWYENHISEVRSEDPARRFGIVHVYADEECVVQRAKDRAAVTGRHIPCAVLKAALESVPRSVSALTPSVDAVVKIDNSGALPPSLDSITLPNSSRHSAAGLQLLSPPWQFVQSLFSSTTEETYETDFPVHLLRAARPASVRKVCSA